MSAEPYAGVAASTALFTHNSEAGSGSLYLFTQNAEAVSGSLYLFTQNAEAASGSLYLFTHNIEAVSGSQWQSLWHYLHTMLLGATSATQNHTEAKERGKKDLNPYALSPSVLL